MKAHDLQIITSSKSDDWSTPKDLYKKLDDEFKFNYDPTPLKAEDKTVLFQDWNTRVFCNPPYSNIRPFIEKALIEIKRGNTEIAVFLTFARTCTKWFHELVYNKPNIELRFIKGRLKLGDGDKPAPAPSMLIIIRKWES